MQYVLVYGVAFIAFTIASWVVLLLAIPIAQKLAQFSMPLWPEALWKLAVIAGATNAASMALAPINFWLAAIAGTAVMWVLLAKWFDVDFFGMMVVVFVTMVVRSFVAAFAAGTLAALLS